MECSEQTTGHLHGMRMAIKYSHPADEYFESLVEFLRHLVDVHGVEESPELWSSGRDRFDVLHAEGHEEV